MIKKAATRSVICFLVQLTRLLFVTQKVLNVQSSSDAYSSQNKLKLSDDLQRALWAQAFINLIMSNVPSYKQIRKQSLHSRLLNLKWPYLEATKGYELNKQIQYQMKKFFMPKVGIYLPKNIFNQDRFDAGKIKTDYMTFYPTYSVTKQMFSRFQQRKIYFLYGKQGIGKSQSIILYCMLSMHILFYLQKHSFTKQYMEFLKFLDAKEAIYWSINTNQTELSLKKIVYYQKMWLWYQQQFRRQTDQKIMKIFNQKFKAVQKDLMFQQLSNISGTVFFDQINKMASLKRKQLKHQLNIKNLKLLLQAKNLNNESQIITQIQNENRQKEKCQNQLSNLKKLHHLIKSSLSSQFYNSSSNVEKTFLSQDKLCLWTSQDNVQPKSLNYENNINRQKENIAMLQLAQFFTNILQQFSDFSSEILDQWHRSQAQTKNARQQFFLEVQDQFINIEWKSIPNAVLIINTLQRNKNKLHNPTKRNFITDNQLSDQLTKTNQAAKFINLCKNSKQLKIVIIKILKQLQIKSQKAFFSKIQFFLSKSVGDDVSMLKRKIMVNIYEKALQASLTYQNLLKEEQPLSFQFFIQAQNEYKIPQILANIDRQVFSYDSQDQLNHKLIRLRCSLSPQFFSQTILSLIYGKYIHVHKTEQLISPEMELTLIKKGNRVIGKFYDKNIMQLFIKKYVNLVVKIYDKDNKETTIRTIQNYNIFYIKNFVKDENSSFKDKFQGLFQYSSNRLLSFVCIPQQFFQSHPNQYSYYAFDFLYVYQKSGSIKYQFVDITLSMDIDIHKEKIIKFVQMLSKQEQFKQLTKPASHLDKHTEEVIKKYKGNISFLILSSNGKNQYLDKNAVIQLFQGRQQLRNVAESLDVYFIKCYASEQVFERQREATQDQYEAIIEFNRHILSVIKNNANANRNKA